MPVDLANTILEGGRQRAATLLKLADIGAEQRANSGKIWGQTLANLGQIAGQVAEDYSPAKRAAAQLAQIKLEESKREAADKKALGAAFAVGSTEDEVMAALRADPNSAHLIPTVQEHFTKVNQAADARRKAQDALALSERNHLGALAAGVAVWNNDPQTQMFAFDTALQHALEQGYDPQTIKQIQATIKADPSKLPTLIQGLIAQSPEQQELAGKQATTAATVSNAKTAAARLAAEQPGIIARGMAAERDYAVGPPKTYTREDVMVDGQPRTLNKSNTGEYTDPATGEKVTGRFTPMPRAAQSAAGGAAADDASNVRDAVAGMKDHTLPPQLPGRASRDYTAIMAEARRQGVDLVKLNEDWNATQKYLSTMNSATQVRFRQAVKFAKDSLPLMESLIKEWDGGQYPVLNSANLAIAKQGAFGDKAASIATRLSAQISDMTSELGTVYKGGNSSTDESLKLAAENLKGPWSRKVALDAVAQIRKNIEIREASIRFGAPVTNDANPYYQTPAGPGAGGGPGVRPPTEGERRPVPGYPGQTATYRGGKWVVD